MDSQQTNGMLDDVTGREGCGSLRQDRKNVL